ncbi:MAG: sulfatase-like hydrolase/transferase [Patescibacteria group bacterium]
MKAKLINFIKKIGSVAYAVAGSFVISAGWSWYHIAKRPHWRFVLIACLFWLGIFAGYCIFKWLYGYLTTKLNRHNFWQTEFKKYLDSLFFILSLSFLAFFSRWEWLSLVYFLFIFGLLFWRLQFYLGLHPNGNAWKKINRQVFVFILFLFLLLSGLQYAAYHYYILDPNIKFYNIVLFRSWAMTMFWVLGFALSGLLYWRIKKKVWRHLFLIFWSLLFVAMLIVWVINVGIMYFSGLYLNPVMLGYAKGASSVIFNWLTPFLISGGVLVLVIFALLFKQVIRAHDSASKNYWQYYNLALIAVALLSIFGLSSFKNTPEYTIVRSFYRYFAGQNQNAVLSPIEQAKLERFGLHFNLNEFAVAHKEKVFSTATFSSSKPNIIIVFFESFSSRLTDVYNPNFKGLTPGLDKMAADPFTTVFHKYYNASTPTITGILSQLCSFLPPTGYNEINNEKKLQRIYALCLPQILKNSGYKYASYITSVDKNYENKNSILSSIGVGDIYGTAELGRYISAKPLSWGYSDHQMFPAFWQIINEKTQSPFLAMISTIDSHPPFNLSADIIKYGDGKNNLLNSVYSTDDAFAKFWNDFKASDLSKNTILIAVADHAVFPAAYTKDIFPDVAGKISFYDENMFMMYVPDTVLPKSVDMYSSGLDFTPTLLQILNINVPNSFEGHSIFDDQKNYPNLLGMHELELYINQIGPDGKRIISHDIPTDISCGPDDYTTTTNTPLTPCEYLDFYKWEKQMFEQGRMW